MVIHEDDVPPMSAEEMDALGTAHFPRNEAVFAAAQRIALDVQFGLDAIEEAFFDRLNEAPR